MYLDKIQVLVLGVGGNVSQGIIKALRYSNLPMNIIGACIEEYSRGLYMCDEAYICPCAYEKNFISWVISFCNEHNVDIIFTGVEENILQFAKKEDLIKESTKAIFISSSYDQLIIGQDKFLTCQFLEKSGCNFPKYQLWTSISEAKEFAYKVRYPIIAKPRNGKGSRDIHVFNSETDIEKFANLNNYILEQYIGDTDSEYTVGCYIDKNGILQKIFPMKRKLFNGTTVWAKTVENSQIIEECTKICEAFKPKGPFNIQLRIDKNGVPICFELNVRYSGTTAIRSKFGFQDVKAMILEYVYGEDISDCFHFKSGEVFRFDEELYLNADATDIMKSNGMLKDIRKYLLDQGEKG